MTINLKTEYLHQDKNHQYPENSIFQCNKYKSKKDISGVTNSTPDCSENLVKTVENDFWQTTVIEKPKNKCNLAV